MEFRSNTLFIVEISLIKYKEISRLDENSDGTKMVKVSKKSIALIEEIFVQGDTRYLNYPDAVLIASFLDNKAIEIKKSLIPSLENPSEDELNSICNPQRYYKLIGKKLLEEKGYNLIGFEIPFCSGRADILAKNPSKNETIAVECCSCRINKVLSYLKNVNTALWVISLGETGAPDEKLPLFIIKRGPQWDKCLKIYQQDLNENLKNIKSPLDTL